MRPHHFSTRSARSVKPFHLKIGLASVAVLQRPTSVGTLRRANNFNRISQTFVIRRIDGLKIIERAKHVVVPARRKRKAQKNRLDDLASTMRAEKPVRQKKFTPALLRSAHGLKFASAMKLPS